MLTADAALDRLHQLLVNAGKAGADSADALYVGESSVGIGVRLGKLEDIGRSEGEEIALRVFVGKRSAQVSVSDLSAAALAEATARAVAMAREATEDAFAGLADATRLAPGPFPDLDLFDPAVEALDADTLKQMALEAEDSARAVPGVSNSEGGSATAGSSLWALVTSHGFHGTQQSSSISGSAVVVAGADDHKQRDYAWHQARHLTDFEAAADIGRRAGARAVSRLNPVPAPTGPMPVVFDPRVSASLLGHLISAINGAAIARKTSFLLGREKEMLFHPSIRIVDDPLKPRGLRSRCFDGEGLPTARRDVVSDGRVFGWLVDSATGRQLGLPPTGHASRGSGGPPSVSASNLWMEPGDPTPDDLMSDIKIGLYVTELIGMGVSILTGDYSRGAGGFLIRDGKLAEPVSEATIAGHLADMFGALRPANDLSFRYQSNAPTIRIDGMTVAGQ